MPKSPAAGAVRPCLGCAIELVHLYVCEGWSVRRIAARTGRSRRRVATELRTAGVALAPRGAGRARPLRRPENAALTPERLRALYVDRSLTAREIGRIVGMPDRRIIDRLHRFGIPTRSRGTFTRADRRTVAAPTLRHLYLRGRMSATAIGERTGVSRHIVLRSAHDLGFPVRTGGVRGAVTRDTGMEIELIDSLYADPAVATMLRRYQVPRVPPGGSITVRFPDPVPVSDALVRALYADCGMAARHIELVTGQPAGSVRRRLRAAGVPMRSPGGRSPFLRRASPAHAAVPPGAAG